jgi:hypothetical protein
MDYMQLYRKYTYEERHSYSLDAIGEYELDERKTAYEGTLDHCTITTSKRLLSIQQARYCTAR